MHEIAELLDSKKTVTREHILALQEACFKNPAAHPPVRHFFSNGVYGRELFIPKGMCAVGKIHKHDQITVVVGDITIVTPGATPRRITGYETFSAPAGIKRAVRAHDDTFVTTFHSNPTDTQDQDELEAWLIAPSFEALDSVQTPEALT
jgi:hypothetical protein